MIKFSDLPKAADSSSFKITNLEYGSTFAIFKCPHCGFLQCSEAGDVLAFYENMKDEGYEETRSARALQEKMLLERIRKHKSNGKLLDVGAASGLLVEQALRMGYEAKGIEPSEWLQKQAVARGLPVIKGSLPHPEVAGPYDCAVLVDVIEHVTRPHELVQSVRRVLASGGIAVVVTPDRDAIAARLLGHKWWHYRTAHVGYFNVANLDALMQRSGFRRIDLSRPGWYFTLSYVAERIGRYLPGKPRLSLSGFLKNWVVPINLGDSIMGIYQLR